MLPNIFLYLTIFVRHFIVIMFRAEIVYLFFLQMSKLEIQENISSLDTRKKITYFCTEHDHNKTTDKNCAQHFSLYSVIYYMIYYYHRFLILLRFQYRRRNDIILEIILA